MDNSNPLILESKIPQFDIEIENDKLKLVTQESIFQLLRNIKDPEHILTVWKS